MRNNTNSDTKGSIPMNEKNNQLAKTLLPILGAVLVVAGAIAYICLKLADELKYKEKWKDYDECGWH